MTSASESGSRHGATTRELSRVNSTTIVRLLRESGALSRQEISARTGLSSATVNRLTSTLLGDKVIAVAGNEPSRGGRPSVLLRFAGETRLVAALQLLADRAVGVLVDLDGKIVFRKVASFSNPIPEDAKADAIEREQAVQVDQLVELAGALIATAKGMGSPCLAVGVAVPGNVDAAGTVARMPEMGWNETPLGRLLRERVKLPLVIENDANALAWGELTRGAGRGSAGMVALLIGRGLGAGIISGAELHRGGSARAGEVGYLLTNRAAVSRYFTDHGDLEDRIGSVALTRTARERGIPIPATGWMAAEDVFALSAAGNADAAELELEIFDMASIAATALVAVLDPDLLVVGSSYGDADRLVAEIHKRLAGRVISVPRIVAATLREDAVIIGAAELAAAEVHDFAYLSH
jgi:predicted NBD/HSP70 family sugar kinase